MVSHTRFPETYLSNATSGLHIVQSVIPGGRLALEVQPIQLEWHF
jgi:hypothetical protein